MTKAIQNILKAYGSDSPGTLSHLSHILQHGELGGTGKLLIFPVDQGFEHGPAASFSMNPPAYDPSYHVQLAIESGCSAFAAPYGFLDTIARDFTGQIPFILKVNNSDSLYKDPLNPLPAITSGVQEALRLGCSAIGFTIYPGSGAKNRMYEDVVRLNREAREAGLVTVIWSYPRGGDLLSKEGEVSLDVVAYACQIAAQLGAHIIKVKPPQNQIEKQKKIYAESSSKEQDRLHIKREKLSDRVSHILDSAFSKKRIVIFSGGSAKSTEEVLKEIKELAQGGSFGSIVGRNVFQRPRSEALELLKKIVSIYKEHSNAK